MKIQFRPWRSQEPQTYRLWYYTCLFFLIVFSGLYALVANSWSPFFRMNLIVHPMLGAWITISLVRTMIARLRGAAPSLTYRIALAFFAVIFLALLRSFTLKHLPIRESNKIAGAIFLALIFITTYLLVKGIPLLRDLKNRRTAWLDISTVTFWSLTAAVGIAILIYGGGRDAAMLFDFHTFVGAIAAVIGLIALLRPTWGKIFRSGIGFAPLHAAIILLAIAAVADGVGGFLDPTEELSETTLHLSTIRYDARVENERDAASAPLNVPAEWLEVVDGCGGGACHDAMIDDHRHSLHNNAFKTQHMTKTLALLHEEIGQANEKTCYGCHTPSALFAPGATAGEFAHRDNLGCTFCHSLSAVDIVDPSRSELHIKVNTQHLRPFVEAAREGKPVSRQEQWLIRLNPGAHGRALVKDFYKQDVFCMGCHQPTLQAVRSGRACIDCHMEERQFLPLTGQPGVRNHVFPGANIVVPELLGMPSTAMLNQEWLQGKFLTRTLLDLYKNERRGPRLEGTARLFQYQYLNLTSQVDRPWIRDQVATLRVITENINVGHAFPSSSLDLLQAWLHLTVTDKAGRIVFESGTVASDQSVDPEAHTMGGYLLDREGKKITHYRIWNQDQAVVERRIEPGGSADDTYTFPIPADVGDWLNVAAEWNYRKFNKDYWDWAYGPALTIPTVTVVEHFTQYPVLSASLANSAN